MADSETSAEKGLSHSAYGGVKGEDYVPFVPARSVMPELTVYSLIIGAMLAALFAAANTYLALKVGMTIAAGIPAAILGTGLLRFVFKRNHILEANMVSGVAAMGESLAGGIVFTLPAIIIWGFNLSLSTIVMVTILGGALGVFFVVPLRRYLTVEEHGKLAFPESMAAAEVLVTGNAGGEGFKTVISGFIAGGLFKFLAGGLLLWKEEPNWEITLRQNGKPIYETFFGLDAMASLAGVGFIVGLEASLYMFSGALVATFGLVPLIKYIGAGLAHPIFPSTLVISEMTAGQVRGDYIRYIGAGAVAAGGFISLAKSAPTIVKSFKAAMSGIGGKTNTSIRTDLDVPMTWVIGSAATVFAMSWLLPIINVGFIGALMAVLFSFFFAVVSARICGIIGASNNPVSGMTIATLLFATSVLKFMGYTGEAGLLTAIMVGGVACVAIAVAGGAGQSLKTTYIIGGTPKRMEIGMFVGIAFSSIFAGLVMLLLIKTYGIGTEGGIAAPQATLMSMVIKGVMDGQLPWALVLVGVTFGVMCELMGLPVLPVALGIYLPIHLSSGILVGGLVRWFVERKFNSDDATKKNAVENGVLLASGLVAGDAILGIIVAGLAAMSLSGAIGIGPKFLAVVASNSWFALLALGVLAYWIYRYIVRTGSQHS
jgi:putative OPT family oligopeptide transporter